VPYGHTCGVAAVALKEGRIIADPANGGTKEGGSRQRAGAACTGSGIEGLPADEDRSRADEGKMWVR